MAFGGLCKRRGRLESVLFRFRFGLFPGRFRLGAFDPQLVDQRGVAANDIGGQGDPDAAGQGTVQGFLGAVMMDGALL